MLSGNLRLMQLLVLCLQLLLLIGWLLLVKLKKCCDLSMLQVKLMEEIWAWLPIESVCRFRSVSKEWNVLLSSREFLTNKWVKKSPNRDPWLVTVLHKGSNEGVENTRVWLDNTWVVVQAPRSLASCFFDQTSKETSAVSLSLLLQNSEFYGFAAGLFLFRPIRDIMALVVCNPLTTTSVELPVSSLDVIYNARIMSDNGDAYKVVVMGTTEQSVSLKFRVEIYDSVDKSWRIAGHLPENVMHVGRQLVFCNGYFYCLAMAITSHGQWTVVGYNIGEGTSIFRPLPERADGQSMMFELMTCGSRVLVAAHIFGNSKQLSEVIIWELENVKLNSSSSSSWSSWWKEIARMSPSNLERYSMNGEFCDVVGVGDSICFIVFEGRKVKEILAYNVTENTWSWLLSRPLDTIADGWEISVAFEPTPDMKVD